MPPRSPSPTVELPRLRAAVDDRVITPDDPGYDQARTIFYGGFERRPAAIVRPADAAQVAQVVNLARDGGYELAVRAGGHSTVGHGLTEGGIVLDLSELSAIEVDPEARTARAQAGLTTGAYTAAVQAHGLVTGFGDTASVGVSGLTLGGGVGYLVRKHGLAIDSLLAAELVTADGQILEIDDERHPDLFWAIRGGGGNFGVATRLTFRLHPLDGIVGGMLLLPATAQVIADFMAASETAPEELSGIANVMVAPPMPFLPPEAHGKLVVMAMLCYAGEAEAGQRALAPFRALAEPLADMLQPGPYAVMFPPEEGAAEEYHPTAVSHTMFMDTVDRQMADTIIEQLQASDALVRVVQLRALGGAMARVPVEATAFAHRHSRIMANVAAFYEGPADRDRRQAWVDDTAAALQQGDEGAYVNFLGDERPGRVRQAYPGSTWDRLVEVKRRYDPDNLFRRNHNIPPA
jgi:FAD/FMN-containing dehydrogenase